MMHAFTHEAARGYAPACPDGAACLPACLLVCSLTSARRKLLVYILVPGSSPVMRRILFGPVA
eukprot:6377240-Prymnesium_polylepis.1